MSFARPFIPAAALICALALTAYAQPADEVQALRAELAACPNQILFERYEDENWDLWIMNADGSGMHNFTKTPGVHDLYAQASLDGSKICFLVDVERDGDTLRSVYYMNADGSGRTLAAEKARQPCWSPDGKRIAFVPQEFDKFNVNDYVSKGLCFFDLESGEITKHPNEAIEHLYNLSWAPNGKWIVSTVHGGMGFKHGIIAIQVDGMGVFNLGVSGCRPCVSPDGKRLTWSSDDNTISIADIDLDSAEPSVSNVRALHHDETLHLYHPDFSPDGKYITFSVGHGGRVAACGPGTHTNVAEMVGVPGKWDIYVKRSDGTGPAVPLTTDTAMGNKESEWLPR